MAKLVSPDGKITDIEPKNGKTFELDELYEAIGCKLVQVCRGNGTKILIFDEEFRCRGDIVGHPKMELALEPREDGEFTPWLNRLATQAMHYTMGPFEHNIICGKCVVCESEQFE